MLIMNEISISEIKQVVSFPGSAFFGLNIYKVVSTLNFVYLILFCLVRWR